TSPASSATPTAVAGTGTVSGLSAGGFHACTVTTAGALRCWGRNDKGQLGLGSTSDAYTPATVTVAGGTVGDVATGALHTCAVLNTGTVQCWGDNQFGQLGTGDISQRTAPVSVASLPAVYTTTTAPSSSTSSSTPTSVPVTTVSAAADPTSTTTASTTTSTSTSTTAVVPTTTSTVALQKSSAVARTGTRADVLMVRRGRTLTAARIAGATGLSIPRGSQGRLRLSIVLGGGRCRFAGTSVRGTAVGTCRVRAVLIRTKGPTLVRTVTVRVVR
ncbi:MAG: RCC1 domain-containing protein, partial [Acidimicrobiales bacterium]